jgi:hypothetical protein
MLVHSQPDASCGRSTESSSSRDVLPAQRHRRSRRENATRKNHAANGSDMEPPDNSYSRPSVPDLRRRPGRRPSTAWARTSRQHAGTRDADTDRRSVRSTGVRRCGDPCRGNNERDHRRPADDRRRNRADDRPGTGRGRSDDRETQGPRRSSQAWQSQCHQVEAPPRNAGPKTDAARRQGHGGAAAVHRGSTAHVAAAHFAGETFAIRPSIGL